MDKQLMHLPEMAYLLNPFNVSIVVGGIVTGTVDGVNDGFVCGHFKDSDLLLVVCHFSFHEQ